MHLQIFALLFAVFIMTAASADKGNKDVTKCASDGSPQLRFVTQLRVNGCPLFVYETGANYGPHLVVEPLMCVREILTNILPRYDPLTKKRFVSIPVILRDDAMLKEVQRHLQHLSPKSVKFAPVSSIRVSTDPASAIKALGFDWMAESATGILNLEYNSLSKSCGIISRLKNSEFDILNAVLLTAVINLMGSSWQRNYRLVTQNQRFFEPEFYKPKLSCLPSCQNLQYIRSINLNNCITRVHQRLDTDRDFLIEALLCHNIANMSSESIMYDYSREMYYLKLDVTVQDINMNDVKAQIYDLEPNKVIMMRLWSAQSLVASALSHRFVIGPLMVSADWTSAQVRVYCMAEYECKSLRSDIISDPFNLWRHVTFSVSSMIPDDCVIKSDALRYLWKIQENGGALTSAVCSKSFKFVCPAGPRTSCKYFYTAQDGRSFVKILQRLTGKVSFQLSWAEYERGFGDDTDFWIGLSTIHSLSINGATLRVEMKLWNGTEWHMEYAGFKVGDASTKYLMTFREMLKDRSSNIYDAMNHHKGRKFSTMDRDNDDASGDCSNSSGSKAGWWFGTCHDYLPTGIYGGGTSGADMHWWNNGFMALREVRLMLQI